MKGSEIMARYIDADELISWIVNEPSKVGDKDIPLNNEYDGSAFRQIEILGHIESMQTADVVERKKGKWKDGYRSSWDGTRHWYRYCDRCGYERDDDDPVHDSYFCPNCGAEMEADNG